jgi:hypothetical protein
VATLTALYDACVLYPAPLRDLLMHLALTDLFRARWTEAARQARGKPPDPATVAKWRCVRQAWERRTRCRKHPRNLSLGPCG